MNDKEFAKKVIEEKGGIKTFSDWFGCTIQMTYKYLNNGFNKKAIQKLKLAGIDLNQFSA
jgi:hypothetical protein